MAELAAAAQRNTRQYPVMFEPMMMTLAMIGSRE
jgi:hypothetical protein